MANGMLDHAQPYAQYKHRYAQGFPTHCCCCWAAGLWIWRKLEVGTLCRLLCCYCCLGGSPSSVKQHKQMYRDVRQPGYICVKIIWQTWNKYFDTHKQSQQPCAHRCVAYAQHVAGSVQTMGSVHACGRQRWNDEIFSCLLAAALDESDRCM